MGRRKERELACIDLSGQSKSWRRVGEFAESVRENDLANGAKLFVASSLEIPSLKFDNKNPTPGRSRSQRLYICISMSLFSLLFSLCIIDQYHSLACFPRLVCIFPSCPCCALGLQSQIHEVRRTEPIFLPTESHCCQDPTALSIVC